MSKTSLNALMSRLRTEKWISGSHWLTPNACTGEEGGEVRAQGSCRSAGFPSASGRPHNTILSTRVGQSLGGEDFSPG